MAVSPLAPFVFVSYAHEDKNLVDRFVQDLQNSGVAVWINNGGLQPGVDSNEAIHGAVRESCVVLLLITPAVRQSRSMKDELTIAEMYKIPIYPVWLGGEAWAEIAPIPFIERSYIDARAANYTEGLKKTARHLRNIQHKASMAPAIPTQIINPAFEPRNPYKGLCSFTQNDANDFFGRAGFVDEIIETLVKSLNEGTNKNKGSLLALVGPSGSGNSSVVMAGLLPRLQKGHLPGSDKWLYLSRVQPGKDPIQALALALNAYHSAYDLETMKRALEEDEHFLYGIAIQLASQAHPKIVMFIDQFEELFTSAVSLQEQKQFVNLLVTAVTRPLSPLIVVLTLRADRLERTMRYPQLSALIDAQRITVLPIKDLIDIRIIIEEPASLPDVQLQFEDKLVGDLLFDVQGQEGALPLLQFALDSLFQHRFGHMLTVMAYRNMDGLKGALAKHAEETYASLPSDEHRELTRTLFLRLIELNPIEQDDLTLQRRRVFESELELAEREKYDLLKEVVEVFVQARLLVADTLAGKHTIEVSHEILLHEWERLFEWVKAAQDDIRLQHRISSDVEHWLRRGKANECLYRGKVLDDAEKLSQRMSFNENEIAFIQKSIIEQHVHQKWEVVKYSAIGLGLIGTAFTAVTKVQTDVQLRKAKFWRNKNSREVQKLKKQLRKQGNNGKQV